MTHKGCVIQLSTTWEKGDPWVKRPKSIKKWMSYGNLPLLLRMVNNLGRFSGWFLCHCQCQIFDSIEFLIGQKWDPWVVNCTKKIQNPSRKGWVMAIFPLIGCVIPMRTKRDKRGSLGVHLYQKDPKSVKKWLSYGYFPAETERLRPNFRAFTRGVGWNSPNLYTTSIHLQVFVSRLLKIKYDVIS